MTTLYLKIEVDMFADESEYQTLFEKLKSISGQILAESVVDAVKVIREDFVCD